MVVAAAPVGITTYDADGDRRCQQQCGNKDEKAIGYGAAGGRGNKAINKRTTNNINNK